jgi:hypothetical protein
MRKDAAVETLLDLHGLIVDQGGGYWVKIEAWEVDPTPEIPHGIRYSLTLHDPYGKRVLGFDNAHAIKQPERGRFSGRVMTFDHRHGHATDKGAPYEFRDPYQLLTDFFGQVDELLASLRSQ